MNYAILLKTVVDANGKTNSVEKVPMMEVFPTISLESMYKLCECELVDIKDMPLQLVEFDGELGIIPAVTLVFDEEFLLKTEKPMSWQVLFMVTADYMISACAVTCCCATQTRKATACRSARVKRKLL